jgi:beta-lactamase class A
MSPVTQNKHSSASNSKRVHVHVLVALCVFLVGIWVGTIVTKARVSEIGTETNAVREKSSDYKFISPLLFTDNLNPDTRDYKMLDANLKSYIKTAVSDKQADQVSVYFRDLNTGHWMGINENDQYEPASLLKIAILTTYLRMAEITPGLLDKSLEASIESPNLDLEQNYKPANPIHLGKPYTVRSLLSSMIVDSDNNAMALLAQDISTSTVNVIYNDLQIPISNNGAVSDISAAEYSRFFRILYNSSYLSHSASESVLGLLSETDFSVGLVAGVPAGTTVAHKFGEREESDGVSKQLHDCGIVYYPEHPYFVCVMTKGKDFASLEKTISSISKMVWDDVAGRN